ncbi:MAG: hypothetical protein FWG90_07265 [Oscillospiraceae bacterium]|nr:hypothetical protein [Oscillospiraceae bacterium]
MNIKDSDHIAEIWLTNEEQQNEELRQSLELLYEKYKAQKYKICIFCSGKSDLTENTARLLFCNKALNTV